MKKLSVCLIVKDEEIVLNRILNCVSKFADEIVVVDTGSSDNTVEIAKSFTDKVYYFEWQNDFSKARNFSFSKATCEFVMWIDADDFVTDYDINQINLLKQDLNNADVFMFKYSMGFNQKNQPTFTYFRERIIRRSLNLRWQGFVHEVISPVGKIEYCNIEIQHRKIKAGNPKRNLNIYRKAIKENITFDARETYYYARELYYNGYLSSCIKQMKKFLKFNQKFIGDVYGAYSILAECYLIKNKPQNALNLLLKFAKTHSPSPEICCLIAQCFNKLNNLNNAVFWFKCAINCEPQKFGFSKTECQTLIPYLELTRLYYLLGNVEKSLEYHKLCLQTDINNKAVQHNIQFFNSLKKI